MLRSEILLCITLMVLTLLVFGYYAFDDSIPIGDARSHIFKISMYSDYLSGNGTEWNLYWYSGIPFDDFYPPMYYLIGALINKLIDNPIISYKITFSFSMVILGLSLYIMSRRLLKLSSELSFISAMAFLTFPSILKMYYYQTAPNFLALGFSILAITLYKIISDSFSIKIALLASLLTGLTLLTHPFPFLMILIALAWIIIEEIFAKRSKSIILLIIILAEGLLLTIPYLLPLLSVVKWASPIYTRTYSAIGKFAKGLMALMFTYTFTCLMITFLNKRKLSQYVASNTFFLAANAITFLSLGIGLVRTLPLGEFLHESRFSALSAPAFIIPLVIVVAKYPFLKKLLVLLPISFLLTANIIAYPEINLVKMHTRYTNYLTNDYKEIANNIDTNYRVLIPPHSGKLTEGDSYVTLAKNLNIRSVNGPYNQGDPKFFDYTVLVEWQEKWLRIPYIRENLMQWGCAKYIFVRNNSSFEINSKDFRLVISNSYGKLWELKHEVKCVIKVSPLLLDLSIFDERIVSYVVSYFMPEGYKFILVSKNLSKEVPVNAFKGVIVDSSKNAEHYFQNYPKVFVIQLIDNDTSKSSCIALNSRFLKCYLPYYDILRYVYTGPIEDVAEWGKNDVSKPPLSTQIREILSNISKAITKYLNFTYIPIRYYRIRPEEFKLENEFFNGTFILIKESYFPYWVSLNKEIKILRTTTGFLLIYISKPVPKEIVITYEKPSLLRYLPIVSSVLFVLFSLILVWRYGNYRREIFYR